VKLPALTPSVAALLSDTAPPEMLPCKVAVAPLSSNEPPLIVVNVAAEVAVARPALVIVPTRRVAALTDPPLRVASCKKPLAETVPVLTPTPLMIPLPLSCVTPEPDRLPKVTDPAEANVAFPRLLTAPNVPLPEIVALPVVLMVNGALKLTALRTAPETVMLLVDARAPAAAVKVPAVTDVAPV